jgi:type I restriction enzyme S subunit
MLAELRPYASYKDSGGPWLGAIPEHWEQRALSTISAVRNDRGRPDLPLLSVFLDRGVIRYEEGGGQVHAPSLDLSNYQVVEPGDFVLNNQQAWRGSVGVSRYRGIISPAYIVLELSGRLNSGFATYLVRSPVMVDQFVIASKGVGDIQRQIFWPFLRHAQMLIPPADEQVAIVEYLDYIERRIRHYIRAKQKLIKLLDEQRQAIIHRLVTRGVDSNTELRPSGVEWLGNIPSGWAVQRAKSLFREVDHRSTTGSEVLLSLRMHQGLVPHNDVAATPIPAENLIGFKKVVPGQIVMNRMRAAIGLFGVATQAGIVSPDYAVFDTIEEMNADFFLYLFKTPAARAVFRQESKGLGTGEAGFMRLYTDRFGIITLPVPSPAEQAEIVDSIKCEVSTTEKVITRTSVELALVQEFRTRLIADVVTGKLDVREATASLPDEINQEDISLDEMEPFGEGGLDEDDSSLVMSLEEVEP